MALPMVPIYTQTVGAGGASSILFQNIPQYYTDLVIKVSARTTAAAQMAVGYIQFGTNGTINNTGNNYSHTYVQGYGSGAYSGRSSNQNAIEIDQYPGANATANTFANIEFYIPNYAGSNYKQVIYDDAAENNSTTDNNIAAVAGLWRNTNSITMVLFYPASGNFAQYSTFSLYGILRAGA